MRLAKLLVSVVVALGISVSVGCDSKNEGKPITEEQKKAGEEMMKKAYEDNQKGVKR